MSSDCPPQLQLSIQPATTSFKRSFEEFGFDLESPVGPRAASGGGSGTTQTAGNERNKRVRSTSSLDSEGDASTGASAASEALDGGDVRAIEPPTTTEPPRLPTPVLPDVDMPTYPEEEEEEQLPSRAPAAPSPSANRADTFQLSLDRFNAFDREIEVLRQPEPNIAATSSPSSAFVSPASPPVLPPLIIDAHRTMDFLEESLPPSASSANIPSSSTVPVRLRESPSPPVRFRQNLDIALERLRSPSPLAPDFVAEDAATTEEDEEQILVPRLRHGPPTLPPIPSIHDDLPDDGIAESSAQDEEPATPLVQRDPPILPPIPSVSESFPDANQAGVDQNATPQASPPQASADARRGVDLEFERDIGSWFNEHVDERQNAGSPAARFARDFQQIFGRNESLDARRDGQLPTADFERDFNQWFGEDLDHLSPSSASTSAATAGTEREIHGQGPSSGPHARSTSPRSPPSPFSAYLRRSSQAVQERMSSLSAHVAEDRRPFTRYTASTSDAARSSSPYGTTIPSSAWPDVASRTSALDRAYSLGAARLRYNFEERRLSSLGDVARMEDGWSRFRDRLASEIEATEHRLRRRPRFLGDTVAGSDSNDNANASSSGHPEGSIRTAVDIERELSRSTERLPNRDYLRLDQDSFLERYRRRRDRLMNQNLDNQMDISDDEGHQSDAWNHRYPWVQGRTRNEADAPWRSPFASRRASPPPPAENEMSRDASRSSMGEGFNLTMWAPPGAFRQAAESRAPLDRFHYTRNRTLPRPGASNSLVAESASEARRQADFESIRRRLRPPYPLDDLRAEQAESHDAMDVDDDDYILPPRRVPNASRRHSPDPPQRDRPPYLDLQYDFERRHIESTEDRLALLLRQARDEAFRPGPPPSGSSGPVPPAPTTLSPWELPDVSLPFGSLFETLGEGRNTRNPPEPLHRLRSNHGRTESAPTLPHPDLGSTFTGTRNTPTFGDNHDPLLADHNMSGRSATDPTQDPTNSTEQRHSTRRPFQFVPPRSLAREREIERLMEDPMDDPLGPLNRSRVWPPGEFPGVRREIFMGSNAGRSQPPQTTTSSSTLSPAEDRIRREREIERLMEDPMDDPLGPLNRSRIWAPGEFPRARQEFFMGSSSAGRSQPPQTTSTSSSSSAEARIPPPRSSIFETAYRRQMRQMLDEPDLETAYERQTRQMRRMRRQMPDEPPALSRDELTRPSFSANFLPGPFRNTLRHAERHTSRAEPSTTSHTGVFTEQPARHESAFTSRPLPADGYYVRPRETPASVFPPSSQTEARQPAPQSEYLRLLHEHEREFRRRHEALHARTLTTMRRLREREQERETLFGRSALRSAAELQAELEGGHASNNSSTTEERGPLRRHPATRFRGDYMRDEDIDFLSYESLLSLTDLAGARPRGTPTDILDKMEKSTYKEWKTADSDTRCPICLDDYEEEDPVQKLTNCSHWLHQECLGQWLKSANTCPVCRGSVGDVQSGSGSGRSPRVRAPFGFLSPRRREYLNSLHSGQRPAGPEMPGSHTTTRRGTRSSSRRRAQPAASTSTQAQGPAHGAGTSNAPGPSATNNQDTTPIPSDSEDDDLPPGFMY